MPSGCQVPVTVTQVSAGGAVLAWTRTFTDWASAAQQEMMMRVRSHSPVATGVTRPVISTVRPSTARVRSWRTRRVKSVRVSGSGEVAGSASKWSCSETRLGGCRAAVYAPSAGGAQNSRLSAGRNSSQATRGTAEWSCPCARPSVGSPAVRRGHASATPRASSSTPEAMSSGRIPGRTYRRHRSVRSEVCSRPRPLRTSRVTCTGRFTGVRLRSARRT